LLVGAFLATPACGVEITDRLDLYGYGHLQAQRNVERSDAGGEVAHDVSLLGSLKVADGYRLWAQVAHTSELHRLRLDWAFLDIEVTPRLTAHLGQARAPLGLLNDTRDAQALRATASLPLLYGDDLGLVDESLRGGVADWRAPPTGYGEFTVEGWLAASIVPDAGDARDARLVGWRLSWSSPLPGLTLKLSGYSGRVRAGDGAADEDDAPRAADYESKRSYIVSAQYEAAAWIFSAEAGRTRFGDRRAGAAYVAAEWRASAQWRGFARVEAAHRNNPDDGESITRRRGAVGLAWLPHEHWGARFEIGRNRESGAPGPGSWNDARLSANFVF
jgi:hypothetical protein